MVEDAAANARARAACWPSRSARPVGPGELEIPAVRGVGGSLIYFIDPQSALARVWEVEFEPSRRGRRRRRRRPHLRRPHLAVDAIRGDAHLAAVLHLAARRGQDARAGRAAIPAVCVKSQVVQASDGALRDTDAALRILADYDFGFIHQVLSYLRVHPGSITARTRDYTPTAADCMIALRNHGPTFMDAEELRRRLKSTEHWFYEGVGRRRLVELFSKRDADYWEYQRRSLAAAGQELQPFRVWLGAARAVAISLGSPVDRLRELEQRWRNRRRPRQARAHAE